MIYLTFFQNQVIPDLGISTNMIIIIVVAFVALLIIITVIPSLMVVRKVFGNLSQTNALLASGEPAAATILKMWDTGTTLNDKSNPMKRNATGC